MRTLSADVGGTFTDLVLIDAESGSVYLDKVPSTPGRADAVLEGIKRITGAGNLSADDIDLFVHGFTVATNALLTRRGANVAMVTTQGFRDVLEIGDQMRPHLYHLTQTKPLPVVPRSRIIEVDERLDAFGGVVTPLDEAEAAKAAEALAALEPDAVAVCLAFSYLDPTHEELIERAVNTRLGGCRFISPAGSIHKSRNIREPTPPRLRPTLDRWSSVMSATSTNHWRARMSMLRFA